jgi:hypothetical protein
MTFVPYEHGDWGTECSARRALQTLICGDMDLSCIHSCGIIRYKDAATAARIRIYSLIQLLVARYSIAPSSSQLETTYLT